MYIAVHFSNIRHWYVFCRTVQRGKLGLNILPLKAVLDGKDALPPNARYGLAVTAVVPGSPADAAGVRKGTSRGVQSCARLSSETACTFLLLLCSFHARHNTIVAL